MTGLSNPEGRRIGGPRPARIPIMIGAGGPKMLRLAARHADIWSWYVEERSQLDEFAPRLAALEAACLEVGREPSSIDRSAGIVVEPTDVAGAAEALAIPVRGSAEEIADGPRAFRAGGFTEIEILLWPRSKRWLPCTSCSTPTDCGSWPARTATDTPAPVATGPRGHLDGTRSRRESQRRPRPASPG